MSSSSPQSSDVRTTRYTIKANVETTRYFVSPETDIEHQVNENTQDISAIQAQLLLKENTALCNEIEAKTREYYGVGAKDSKKEK